VITVLLQLLLALAREIILSSESRGTHNHILLSPIRDSHNLEDKVLPFVSLRNIVVWLYPGNWVPFSSPTTTPGLEWRYSIPQQQQQQQQKLTAGNQPARSLMASCPSGTHGHIFVQCQDLCFFFLSLILIVDNGGVGFFINIDWCSLTTPYST
jgi:hypothetical protein